MSDGLLRLPPPYRVAIAETGANLSAEARRAAEAGAKPATVIFPVDEDDFRCAIVLHPEEPLVLAARVVYVAMLGLGDALGAIVPPGIDITYSWPNRLEANTGAVADVGIEWPEGLGDADPPAWLILHARVAIAGGGHDVVDPSATSLREEGCIDVIAAHLMENFARHFLAWVNRWLDDGFGPVRAMWLRHAPKHGEAIDIEGSDGALHGRFDDIDEEGALLLATDDRIHRIDFLEALSHRGRP